MCGGGGGMGERVGWSVSNWILTTSCQPHKVTSGEGETFHEPRSYLAL